MDFTLRLVLGKIKIVILLKGALKLPKIEAQITKMDNEIVQLL
jgi:hypothetical protein